jgi:transposase
MKSIIAQVAHWRKRMVKYALKNGATKAGLRFRISRQKVHKWLKRWREKPSIESLYDRSHRPHTSPKAHTAEEIKLIMRELERRGNDLIFAYQKLQEKGYKRSFGGFRRFVWKNLRPAEKKKPKHNPKPYRRAEYPGEKLQLDVKFVPSECVTNGQKYYQFTALDECTRWTFREMYDEHSTFSAKDFLDKLIRTAPFLIKQIQTDNGTEWTNALLVTKSKHKTLFEQALLDMDIEYKRIRIATPQHNGKAERQHGLDQKRFYSKLRMFSLSDGRCQIAKYNRTSNDIIKICLNLKSPNDVLNKYLHIL